MDNEVVKKKFLQYKAEKGLKWADLAAAAGVANYQSILNRLNTPGLTLATLEKLAALVGCQPWELIKPDDTTQQDHQQAPAIICPHCGQIIIIHATAPQENSVHENALF